VQFHQVPISGTVILNAFGCSLGGGYFFLTEKDGSSIKYGKVIDLAAEIYEEKLFFKKHLPPHVFVQEAFGHKTECLLIMMKMVNTHFLFFEYQLEHVL
jgi:hypothetical protein